MSIRFPYLPVSLSKLPAPPSHPAGTTDLWRPFVSTRAIGPNGNSKRFRRCLVDTGSQDTVFPMAVARSIAVKLLPPTKHKLTWRGQSYPLRYGGMEIELSDDTETWRWSAVIGFCDAPFPFDAILGYYGCLQLLDATFRGDDRYLELETNSSFPATATKT